MPFASVEAFHTPPFAIVCTVSLHSGLANLHLHHHCLVTGEMDVNDHVTLQ